MTDAIEMTFRHIAVCMNKVSFEHVIMIALWTLLDAKSPNPSKI